jgi:NADP-dependent 3-hydroxy acid dehydrogenase YdfG
MTHLEGLVVVVTGASAGIGASLAELLGSRGGKVALLARREKELGDVARASGANALPLVTDVTSRPEVEAAARKAIAHFGHVDVWVNNAGRGITRLVSELTDEDVDEMMRVNVKSALYGMQAILPHFRERKRGHLINVSSMLGRVPFAPFRSAYSASKHALNALTANLRMELTEQYPEIFVSTVSPGVVATEFGNQALHGGMDSRKLPGAQPVEEVAQVIASLIEKPRADVYTRDGAQRTVAAYFAAEDMGEAERAFGHPPRR